MEKPTKQEAIHNLVGGAISCIGDDFTYHDGQTPPTDAECKTEMDRLEAEYDAQAYARNRASDYPSNGDQWDMIYKDNKNSTTTHAAAVEAVKTKWPKDNSGPV
jgi:hypothetical protein